MRNARSKQQPFVLRISTDNWRRPTRPPTLRDGKLRLPTPRLAEVTERRTRYPVPEDTMPSLERVPMTHAGCVLFETIAGEFAKPEIAARFCAPECAPASRVRLQSPASAALADAARLRGELELTKTETVDLRRLLDTARKSLSARTAEATASAERVDRLQGDLDGERRARTALDERLAVTVERAVGAEARVAVGVDAVRAAEVRMLEAVSRAVAAEQRLADLEDAVARPPTDTSTATHT